MSNGWIKVHRKIVDSVVFENPKLLKTWIWCLCKASHTCREVVVGKHIETIQEGQFIFGRIKAAEILNMNDRTVYDYMKMLQELGMIVIDSNNKYSIVTVVNWSLYQNTLEIHQQQNTIDNAIVDTTKNTTETTIKKHTNNNNKELNNNDKEGKKNCKKNIYGEHGNVRLTEAEYCRLEVEYGPEITNKAIRYLDEYIGDKGYKSKSHYLAIKRWVIKAIKNQDIQQNQKSNYYKQTKSQELDDFYHMASDWAERRE